MVFDENDFIEWEALSVEQQAVLNLVRTGHNIFLTGAAGTGKSTLLKLILRVAPPHTYLTATTGVAATQIGGRTIHSFAGIGQGNGSKEELALRAQARGEEWCSCNVLIIDEISMLSAELFEKLDYVARHIRGNSQPFGGIQLIFVGDFFQLPPVIRHIPASASLLHPNDVARPRFCFQSPLWDRLFDVSVELKTIYRQSEPHLIALLNDVRTASLSPSSLSLFKDLTRPLPEDSNGVRATVLNGRNRNVDAINSTELQKLNQQVFSYKAYDGGTPPYSFRMSEFCVAPSSLSLCVGAQVMLLSNRIDSEKLCNGSRGVVLGFEGEGDSPSPVVGFATGEKHTIVRQRFTFEDEDGNLLAFRVQLPLKLSWAITIHKSQGLSIDRLSVHLGDIFEPGHAYVALSRATNLTGLEVRGFQRQKITSHPAVVEFYRTKVVSYDHLQAPLECKTPGGSWRLGDKNEFSRRVESATNHARSLGQALASRSRVTPPSKQSAALVGASRRQRSGVDTAKSILSRRQLELQKQAALEEAEDEDCLLLTDSETEPVSNATSLAEFVGLVAGEDSDAPVTTQHSNFNTLDSTYHTSFTTLTSPNSSSALHQASTESELRIQLREEVRRELRVQLRQEVLEELEKESESQCQIQFPVFPPDFPHPKGVQSKSHAVVVEQTAEGLKLKPKSSITLVKAKRKTIKTKKKLLRNAPRKEKMTHISLDQSAISDVLSHVNHTSSRVGYFRQAQDLGRGRLRVNFSEYYRQFPRHTAHSQSQSHPEQSQRPKTYSNRPQISLQTPRAQSTPTHVPAPLSHSTASPEIDYDEVVAGLVNEGEGGELIKLKKRKGEYKLNGKEETGKSTVSETGERSQPETLDANRGRKVGNKAICKDRKKRIKRRKVHNQVSEQEALVKDSKEKVESKGAKELKQMMEKSTTKTLHNDKMKNDNSPDKGLKERDFTKALANDTPELGGEMKKRKMKNVSEKELPQMNKKRTSQEVYEIVKEMEDKAKATIRMPSQLPEPSRFLEQDKKTEKDNGHSKRKQRVQEDDGKTEKQDMFSNTIHNHNIVEEKDVKGRSRKLRTKKKKSTQTFEAKDQRKKKQSERKNDGKEIEGKKEVQEENQLKKKHKHKEKQRRKKKI
eukprot:GCRY01005912.1.p1 GENE.GCRY01005912.1~~GCRY01005912.1.p1  ORF type:complete len:1136 (+),score=168.15 GCRY01005912.1:24-3410(+)